ncbi:winged helix-turn-helix transcriptional regulator, partial [Candidatus Atribacteria bacterium 1244-E10-H5-B2]
VTGKELVVIDADDPSKLPELFKLLPEAEKTTRVKTKRCFHFYFSNNGKQKIRSTDNLFSLGIELKAMGRYAVAPPSKIDNFTYHFLIPLSQIKPLPEKIIKYLEGTLPGIETGIKEGGQAPGVEYKRKKALSLPRYNGLDRYCIGQILNRELKAGERGNKGERDINLFILYNLLLQNKNRLDHAKKITILKNNSLAKPLTEQEMEKLFKKGYRFKCSTIRETLPYIRCDKCRFKFKGGVLGVRNILIKNIRKLPELTSTESKIALLLGTYYEGEEPTIYEIAKKTGMNKNTIKEAVKKLKKEGIIKNRLKS